MKKEIIKVIVILGLVSNLSADIVEAIGGAIIEVAMPIVIDVSLKSKNQRKADAARAQGQWKKFTSFLGFTDKEENLTNEIFEDKRTSAEKQFDEKVAKEAEEKRIILAVEKSKKEASVTTEECDWGE